MTVPESAQPSAAAAADRWFAPAKIHAERVERKAGQVRVHSCWGRRTRTALVRRLDRKLSNIAAGRYTPDDFVIADAKDADMAFGLTSAGPVTAYGRPEKPEPAGTALAANTSTRCGPWSLRTTSISS